jgi:hypothetical protein
VNCATGAVEAAFRSNAAVGRVALRKRKVWLFLFDLGTLTLMLACINPTDVKEAEGLSLGRYISVGEIVKGKSRLNVHTGIMWEKVHEEKQQISGDYLYLRSIQGNNTDEHKSWPQMLKMNR